MEAWTVSNSREKSDTVASNLHWLVNFIQHNAWKNNFMRSCFPSFSFLSLYFVFWVPDLTCIGSICTFLKGVDNAPSISFYSIWYKFQSVDQFQIPKDNKNKLVRLMPKGESRGRQLIVEACRVILGLPQFLCSAWMP